MSRFVCGGLTTLDLAYLSDVLPERGHKGTAAKSYVDVGGPVANAAVTAVLLGSSAEVHSVFGTGPFSTQARDRLRRYGVDVVDHEPSIDLPVATVWIDGTGERTILSTDNRRSEVRGRRDLVGLHNVAAVLLDGHYPQLQTMLAELAVAAAVPIVLDCGRWRPVFADLLPVATDVIMTATFRPPELTGTPVTEAVLRMREAYGVDVLAASRGSRPLVAVDESGLAEIDIPSVEVVDTTGAGDVLHGAYLHYRYTEGRSPIDALAAAGRVASYSCAALGARQLTAPGSG